MGMSKDDWAAYRAAESKAIQHESRTCFGISWFRTKRDATAYHKAVQARGLTYNGGFFHGMPCGRDPCHDKVINGKKAYAVTD